jgi:hypothetical protein
MPSPFAALRTTAWKGNDATIREMMSLSIDGDEVVVARLNGHRDRLIAKTLAAAHRGGPQGARAALGTGSDRAMPPVH